MLSVTRCPSDRCTARNRSARRWMGLLCFALLFGIVPASHAQTGSEWWVGVGLGLGELFEDEGAADRIGAAFTGALYASYQTRAHLLSVRTTAVSEITGDHVFDAGVLYGRATTGRRGHASFSAGLSLVAVDRNPDNDIDACISPLCDFPPFPDDNPEDASGDEENALTVGVPLEVQVFARPRSVPSFGFGLYVFANVNLEVPFVGATASFQLGSFK